MSYKWCVVLQCSNTSIKTPEKMFLCLPKNPKLRKKWLMLARRNPQDIAANTTAFMCEDHFNMEREMENYRQFKMGFSRNILMVKGALPSKFNCQVDRRKRLSDTTKPAYVKCLKTDVSEETQASTDTPGTSTLKNEGAMPETAVEITESLQTCCEKGTSTEPIVSVDKQVQVTFRVFHRSKTVQTKTTTRDVSLSPLKAPTKSTMTSPYKIMKCLTPSISGQVSNIKKKMGFLNEGESDSDISSFTETVMSQDSLSFVTPSSPTITDSDLNITQINVTTR